MLGSHGDYVLFQIELRVNICNRTKFYFHAFLNKSATGIVPRYAYLKNNL